MNVSLQRVTWNCCKLNSRTFCSGTNEDYRRERIVTIKRRWIKSLFWAAVLTLVFVALRSVFLEARAVATQVSCLGNTNQVNLSVQMYSQDYDGLLPISGSWMDKVEPYCKNWSLFRCPAVP